MTYDDKLQRLLDDIFTAADQQGLDLRSLATRSGLCFATVERLSTYATKLPRLKTVHALAIATGFDLNLVSLKEARYGSGHRQSA